MKRRTFIEKTSLGSAALISAAYIPSLGEEEKIKIGLIGSGWYGMVIAKAALDVGGVEVVAVCDVDSEHLNKSADELEKLQGSRPKTYKEYQELLEQDGLQVILIGTPPHWHALQFIAACEKGYDIYCEKPLAYDVMEGVAMVKAAQKAGNIVQIGFQRRQAGTLEKTKSLIKEGRVGKIHQIRTQIHYNPNVGDIKVQAPPSSLDWDTWCGPAPKLDFRPSIGHLKWRLEKEYGNGHLVDWGIHNIDLIRAIMDFDMPTAIETIGGIHALAGQITTPDTLQATFHFADCPVIWQHRLWGTGEIDPQFNRGVFFYGEEATIFTSFDKIVIMPNEKNAKQEVLEMPARKVRQQHMANFLDAVNAKDASMLSCDIEDGFQSTATVQLAMASYYTGSPVKWDTNQKKIIKNRAASKLLARKYRDGFVRPKV